jgi:hypothetical protein
MRYPLSEKLRKLDKRIFYLILKVIAIFAFKLAKKGKTMEYRRKI